MRGKALGRPLPGCCRVLRRGGLRSPHRPFRRPHRSMNGVPRQGGVWLGDGRRRGSKKARSKRSGSDSHGSSGLGPSFNGPRSGGSSDPASRNAVVRSREPDCGECDRQRGQGEYERCQPSPADRSSGTRGVRSCDRRGCWAEGGEAVGSHSECSMARDPYVVQLAEATRELRVDEGELRADRLCHGASFGVHQDMTFNRAELGPAQGRQRSCR